MLEKGGTSQAEAYTFDPLSSAGGSPPASGVVQELMKYPPSRLFLEGLHQH